MPWSPEPLQVLGTARLRQGDIASAEAHYRAAIALDPKNWQPWLDLAAVLHGQARARAVARARALYPHSPEIIQFENEVRALKAAH
jgi:Flp pilus assembly protein TadD